MRVGVGDVGDVIEWFKAESTAEWLGFFVAGDQKYNQLLNNVLARGDIYDVISGSEIDLFLFGTGSKVTLRGEGVQLEIDATHLNNRRNLYNGLTVVGVGDVSRSAASTKMITKASVVASHRIAEILGLKVDDLPSLAFIRKDFDYKTKGPKLILPTRGQADAEFLIEFIRSMRRALERDRAASRKQVRSRVSDNFLTFVRDVQRQSAFLSNMLSSAGLTMDTNKLALAILNLPSSDEAIMSVAAQCGIESAAVEKILQDDPKARRVRHHLNKNRKAFADTVSRTNDYIFLRDTVYTDLEEVVKVFERRISYRITANYICQFFSSSTSALTKAKKFIGLAAAVKNGGSSLFS